MSEVMIELYRDWVKNLDIRHFSHEYRKVMAFRDSQDILAMKNICATEKQRRGL